MFRSGKNIKQPAILEYHICRDFTLRGHNPLL
jgi:hypothetical protein